MKVHFSLGRHTAVKNEISREFKVGAPMCQILVRKKDKSQLMNERGKCHCLTWGKVKKQQSDKKRKWRDDTQKMVATFEKFRRHSDTRLLFMMTPDDTKRHKFYWEIGSHLQNTRKLKVELENRHLVGFGKTRNWWLVVMHSGSRIWQELSCVSLISWKNSLQSCPYRGIWWGLWSAPVSNLRWPVALGFGLPRLRSSFSGPPKAPTQCFGAAETPLLRRQWRGQWRPAHWGASRVQQSS